MSQIKWIKVTTDIFDNEKISYLEEMPEGDALIVMWFKLLTLAGKKNDCGLIYITKDIPYDEAMLVKVLRKPLNIVKLALLTFQKLDMIEIQEKIIAIKNWGKYQNIEGMEKLKIQWREASKKYREKQKALSIEDKSHKTSYDGHTTDKNRLDKSRVDKNKINKEKEGSLIEDVINYLNDNCKTRFTYKNKSYNKTIAARLNQGYTIDDMKKVVDNKKHDKFFIENGHLNPDTLFREKNIDKYINITNQEVEYDYTDVERF